MLSFHDWLAPMVQPLPELPDGMAYNDDLRPATWCKNCGQLYEWPVDVEDFDPEDPYNLCGGSPRCCP